MQGQGMKVQGCKGHEFARCEGHNGVSEFSYDT